MNGSGFLFIYRYLNLCKYTIYWLQLVSDESLLYVED